MEKPFYFLVLISGIITIASYPMNSDEENRDEVVTFPPGGEYWGNELPGVYGQQYLSLPSLDSTMENVSQKRSAGGGSKKQKKSGAKKTKKAKAVKKSKTKESEENAGPGTRVAGRRNLDARDTHVFTSLKELESDVSGFRDAMGDAAAMLMKSQQSGAKKTLDGEQNKEVTKALQKTDHEKKVFENQLLSFFTNYICGTECKRRKKMKK